MYNNSLFEVYFLIVLEDGKSQKKRSICYLELYWV